MAFASYARDSEDGSFRVQVRSLAWGDVLQVLLGFMCRG